MNQTTSVCLCRTCGRWPIEDAGDAIASGDYAKALRLIRPLANDGDAAAQYNLGLMYVVGRGAQQDYAAAAVWFQKAAQQGYALAQSNLGVLYRDGRGVPQDNAKAADQGDAVTQFLLGNQYAHGIGVWQDLARPALGWPTSSATLPATRRHVGWALRPP